MLNIYAACVHLIPALDSLVRHALVVLPCAVQEAMGPGYFMVGAVHMGQIRLALFARNDVYAAVSNVRTSKQATGVAGVATNKVGREMKRTIV